jgi:NADH-quinone oxidoreductase subunit L
MNDFDFLYSLVSTPIALPWIVLFTPLVSALIILLVTRGHRTLSSYLSVTAVGVAFVGSLLLFTQDDFVTQFTWLDFGPRFTVNFGASINSLSRVMLLVVTGVGLLVHIYSLGYMHGDTGEARYFGGLSLFMFSMLGIVLADNFVMMFIFWELVGVSSYLLIGHWYERPQAADAANKAFIVNRIGDFGFMAGILMLWAITGHIEFAGIKKAVGVYREQQAIQDFLPYLTVATLLIFCGPMGKSAQAPLHVWLPDAMEGPTPVSALIHAATMVAAGVFLLARIAFLTDLLPLVRFVIGWVGIITAVMAALMATQQNDIKRVLAYSTLSQLGYMICAIGMKSRDAAMFHLFTHAFFKALLFLGSGAIIHALHHEQNIWKMGGLRSKMPVTFITFGIGTLALMGLPGLSGFFSKDAILLAMAHRSPIILGLGLFTAFLTAFYMTRLFVVVFFNKPLSESAEHAHEAPSIMTLPLVILAVPSVIAGYHFVGEWFGVGPGKGEIHNPMVPMLAVGAFVLGVLLGGVLYFGKTVDPIRVMFLRRKFYIDEFYAALIRNTQDALAKASAWFDRWVIDGVGVRGLSGGVWGTGFMLRFLQVGNLQAYAFFFGFGVIALIYLAILPSR